MKWKNKKEEKLYNLNKQLELEELNGNDMEAEELREEIKELEAELEKEFNEGAEDPLTIEDIQEERRTAQAEYLIACNNVWNGDLNVLAKETKVRKLYKSYQHKDLFLRRIEEMLGSCNEDYSHYVENMKGGK